MTKKIPLSYGKMRGLTRTADPTGVFCILALDHRGVLKKALGSPDDPTATFNAISAFKCDVVGTLASETSAVLLDPAYGVGPAIQNTALPGQVGMIVTLEESGYAGPPSARISRVASGWGVDKIRRTGGCAVKLLVFYHPQATTADAMRQLVTDVAGMCEKYDLPLFLEALVYSPDPDRPHLSGDEYRQTVMETARHLTPLGADIYKAEFPIHPEQTEDESLWSDACAELSEASAIPWALLSAGVSFEVFARQTRIACQSGASGILAGRAIWKEASNLSPIERQEFLKGVARDRLKELRMICLEHARPWTDAYAGLPTGEDWYRIYPGLEKKQALPENA